jgi:TPR repeat protein
MRIYNALATVGLISLALGFPPAVSFDGTPTPESAVVAVPMPSPGNPELGRAAPLAAVPIAPLTTRPRPTPFEALRSGTQALREGKPGEAVTALEYAAGKGVPGAMWKLGRMYSDGDGVDKNKLRAFEYFQNLTKAHAYDPPGTPESRFVANAFVSLGQIYLEGIPETAVKSDPARARQMFSYAASYFADPDAQYHLAQLFLEGTGGAKDARQAVKWLGLAANKGQYQAQAALGAILFEGTEVARQSAMGLFWLTVAKDSAGPGERWISDTYSRAFAKASDDERALAYRYLENWLRATRRQ